MSHGASCAGLNPNSCYKSGVPTFFKPNLERRGRVARAVAGVSLIVAAPLLFWRAGWNVWICAVALSGGAFVLFEAMRGWCFLRACGIKTKL